MLMIVLDDSTDEPFWKRTQVKFFPDAWSAIDAGRRAMGPEVVIDALSPGEHDGRLLWSGNAYRVGRAVVRQQAIDMVVAPRNRS